MRAVSLRRCRVGTAAERGWNVAGTIPGSFWAGFSAALRSPHCPGPSRCPAQPGDTAPDLRIATYRRHNSDWDVEGACLPYCVDGSRDDHNPERLSLAQRAIHVLFELIPKTAQ